MAKRVLITDDALFMRVTLKNILTKNGYEIAGEASNGKESVALQPRPACGERLNRIVDAIR